MNDLKLFENYPNWHDMKFENDLIIITLIIVLPIWIWFFLKPVDIIQILIGTVMILLSIIFIPLLFMIHKHGLIDIRKTKVPLEIIKKELVNLISNDKKTLQILTNQTRMFTKMDTIIQLSNSEVMLRSFKSGNQIFVISSSTDKMNHIKLIHKIEYLINELEKKD
jgi:hypothetical protein